ncbi:hypothetical protein C0Q70_13877 [Pomacea canaliculata]|uniref:Uncharacterized protein n=1 Tax=Pomacea canaliculata TaxID=400727 RepID=A0A2T7NYF1_POMCA|nr:hypothetical protein C0Q70_13877 [Pomacea canaliculata]
MGFGRLRQGVIFDLERQEQKIKNLADKEKQTQSTETHQEQEWQMSEQSSKSVISAVEVFKPRCTSFRSPTQPPTRTLFSLSWWRGEDEVLHIMLVAVSYSSTFEPATL